MFYTQKKAGMCFLYWIAITGLLFFVTGTANAQLIFNTILNDIQINPAPDHLAYNVDLYVSVLDEGSLPIKDLKSDNFTVLQDSQPIDFTLNEAPEQAMSLVLVIDTSGSMAGEGIQKTRQAVQVFIQQLQAQDSIAMISFNSKVNTLGDFTVDRATLLHQLDQIDSVPGSGTCLYDALFQAVQVSSLVPQGRRAVLVLTDGRDELPNGNVCSSVKLDDVIHASAGSINTPIYSIGVGKSVDENSMQRMALLTGGSFLKSSDFRQVGVMFENIQAQLKNQYMLSFISNAPPGDHAITVKTVIGSSADIVTREIRLPDRGTIIKIVSPESGGMLTGDHPIQVEILGRTDAIAKVRYEIGGGLLGEVSEPPYNLLPDPAKLPAQGAKLTASAIDSNGKVLSSDSIDFLIAAATPTIAPSATPAEAQPSPTAEVGGGSGTSEEGTGRNLIVIGVIIAALILLLALVFLVIKPFNRTQTIVPAGAAINDLTSDSTFDSALPMGRMHGQSIASAVLTVVFSDDRTRIGEKLIIQQAITHIGRSSSNDISFPKDHPVSRNHAVIEFKDGEYLLSESLTGDQSGMKAPTFGTYINEENLGGTPTILHSGDEIRLGNRLRLRFDTISQSMNDQQMVTLDQ